MGSKSIDPISQEIGVTPVLKTKYYTKELHRSYFILPPFVKDLIYE
jgi:spermidine synthase